MKRKSAFERRYLSVLFNSFDKGFQAAIAYEIAAERTAATAYFNLGKTQAAGLNAVQILTIGPSLDGVLTVGQTVGKTHANFTPTFPKLFGPGLKY